MAVEIAVIKSPRYILLIITELVRYIYSYFADNKRADKTATAQCSLIMYEVIYNDEQFLCKP